MKMSASEQIGTGAKSFAETAKPLFIGSIPIAASNSINNLQAATNLK
jgi:hypothetical protein